MANLPPGNPYADPRVQAARIAAMQQTAGATGRRGCGCCLGTIVVPLLLIALALLATRTLALPYSVYYNPWVYIPFSSVNLFGMPGGFESMAWSPDGSRIAAAAMGDRTVHIWDASTGKPVLIYAGHKSIVKGLAWSPDGTRIASGDQGAVAASGLTPAQPEAQGWNATTGQTLLAYHGHGNAPLEAVAWSPDSKTIASVAQDKTVQLWDAATGRKLATYALPQPSLGARLAWSPDGKRLAAEYDGIVAVWDLASQRQIFTYQQSIRPDILQPMAWSPDSQRLAITGYNDHLVQIWDVGANRMILAYDGHITDNKVWLLFSSRNSSSALSPRLRVFAVSWSADGRRLVSSDNNSVQVWDAATGKTLESFQVSLAGNRQVYITGVYLLAWNPAGTRIALSSADGFISVWNP